MENIINVENARRILGDLISRVNKNKQPVIITRRSKEKAILLDYDEHVRLKALAEKAKEDRLIEALEKIQQAVAEAGISYEAVAEAIREVRLPRQGHSHLPVLFTCTQGGMKMLLESEKIISEIKRHVQDRPQVAVAYLMGSYAGGTVTPLSDVDVGIGLYPSLCPNIDDALDLAAALEYSLTEALFPGYDPEPWAEWLFTPVEVVVLNAPHTLSSLPWIQAGALPVHTPDHSFKVELEKLAFRHGRPTPEEATIAAWRLKATWIVRTARGQVFTSYEGILRTCLNLAHRAVVRLGLPVPEERQHLPLVLYRAGIITRRAASFITEAINVLCHDRVDFQAWEYLHHYLHLLADYALQVEDALERTVKQQQRLAR